MNETKRNKLYLNKTKRKSKYNVSQLDWKYLQQQKIKIVFGISGGTILNIMEYIPKSIQWINVGNELTNGYLAQSYGQYTNNVGILFTINGPGIATALSAVKNAVQESNPLLLITGHIRGASKNDFQSLNFVNKLNAITEHIFVVNNPKKILTTLDKAFQIAKHKNTGVILTISTSIQKVIPSSISKPKYKLKKDDVSSIMQVLQNKLSNEKTILVLGKGNYRNIQKVKEFITRNHIPYVTTWKGRCIIDGGINCGRIGTLGNHSANYALYKATHVLIVGNLSGGLTNKTLFYRNKFSSGILKNKKYICSLTIDKDHIEKENTQFFIVQNIETILQKLTIHIPLEWKQIVTGANNVLYKPLPRTSMLEEYCYASSQVYNSLNQNVNVTTDVGNNWCAIGKYFDIRPTNSWHSPTTWASIGISIANAYGMYLANKNPIWAFSGDGGALFSSNIILYLLHLHEQSIHIPMTIFIFKDDYYSALTTRYMLNKSIPKSPRKNHPYFVKTTQVEGIQLDTIIPKQMKKEFSDIPEYYNYLKKNPISKTLRFIFLNIPNYYESNVYEINYNDVYEKNMKTNNFPAILDSKMTLNSEND